MALSPTLSSEEVANDWKEALEDLREASEHAIYNLVTIARENLDYAQAISRVTINHIKNVKSPQAKLIAFYVIDAIVKRIRSPYTMYFGHQLFNLFMGAYTTMDNQHRFQMDKLFETWIVPVPGSHTSEPVFEVQYTKPIQDALNRWRSVVYKQQQESLPHNRFAGQPAGLPARPPQFRPTPPQQQSRYAPPVQQQPASSAMPQGAQSGPYSSYTPPVPSQPTPSTYSSTSSIPAPQPHYPPAQSTFPQQTPSYNSTPLPYAPASVAPPAISQQQLTRTLESVLTNATNDYTRNPSQQTGDLLTTLSGLNMVLRSQTLPQAQLDNIHRELQRIGADFMPKESLPAPALSAAQLIALLGAPVSTPPAISTPPVMNAPMAVSAPIAVSVAPVPVALPAVTPAVAPVISQSAPPVRTAPPPAPGSIFDQLLAAGLVTNTPAPVNPIKPVTVSIFDPASLKERHPSLIQQLYDAKPDQCRQCGRRFAATAEGKKHKASHMDWHFHVNSRVAEATRAGVHRSWYIDEREWIDYREDRDGLPIITAMKQSGSEAKQDPKSRWVPAPADNSGANDRCPICTEKFEKAWDKDADRPVWTDCVKVGARYFHASCYEDFSKASAMTKTASASGRNTPEPLLGKRKAAGEIRGRTKSPRI